MNTADRHIYIFTDDGWKHLETGEVVQRGGIPLDAADVQALKELYIQDADADADETQAAPR